MKLTNPFASRGPRPTRVHIRMACGMTLTLSYTDPVDALGVTELFTNPKPGFTTVPGHLDEDGQLRRINRRQITVISVEAAPKPPTSGATS